MHIVLKYVIYTEKLNVIVKIPFKRCEYKARKNRTRGCILLRQIKSERVNIKKVRKEGKINPYANQ